MANYKSSKKNIFSQILENLNFQYNSIAIILLRNCCVFSVVLQRFILNNCKRAVIKVCNSFTKLKSLSAIDKSDIVFVEDTLTGVATFEVITFLRYQKRVFSPVYYFSNVNTEELALTSGANFFFKKPFDPYEVIDHIKSVISKTKPLIE